VRIYNAGLKYTARGSLKNTGRKKSQKSPSGHHRTTSTGYIFATIRHASTIGKHFKQQYVLQMSSQYGELRPTSGWDRFVSLGHPTKFQLVSRLGKVTALHSSSGRQPNFAALNRGRHLYSAGRPSRWALAHISSLLLFCSCIPGAAPSLFTRNIESIQDLQNFSTRSQRQGWRVHSIVNGTGKMKLIEEQKEKPASTVRWITLFASVNVTTNRAMYRVYLATLRPGYCARLRLYWYNGHYSINLLDLHTRTCWSPATKLRPVQCIMAEVCILPTAVLYCTCGYLKGCTRLSKR